MKSTVTVSFSTNHTLQIELTGSVFELKGCDRKLVCDIADLIHEYAKDGNFKVTSGTAKP